MRAGRRNWDAVAVIAALVILVGTVELFAGALAAGVTTDEETHVERAASWIEDGWYVPGPFLADGEPDPGNKFSTPYVYGPAAAALAHGANALLGNEPLDGVSHSAAAYGVRHLVVAALAALAIAAIGAAVALLTRSRRFGLWAAAGLLAVPRWTGQAFFNIKDVPAAAGYTLVTVALLFALLEDAERPAGMRRRLAIAALLAGGIFVGAGTRLSLWVPIFASLLLYAALRLGQRLLGGVVRDRGTDLAVLAGVAAGAAAIALAYPKAAAKPLTLLADSVSGSAGYPYEGFTLTAGRLVGEHPPLWYLPAWIGGTYPLLLGALAATGLLGGLLILARPWRGLRDSNLWGRRELGLLLVLAQLVLLPLAAVLEGAVIYSGLRQHLYVLPAIAILAGVGAKLAWDWARSRPNPRIWRRLAAVVLAAALIVPMAEQSLLFPYNYAYVNPVAGIGGVNDRWETDYWFASAPEALSRVPRGVKLRCSFFLVPGWEPGAEPSLYPCGGDQIDAFADRRGSDVAGVWGADDKAAWVIARRRGANRPPDYCEETDNVTRWLRGEDVTMAYVLRCDPRRVPPG